MCAEIVLHLPSALSASAESVLIREAQVGAVVPDIVVVDTKTAQWPVRFTGFDCWVVAELLRNKRQGVDALSERIFACPQKIELTLEKLARLGFVDRVSRTTYSLRRNVVPAGAEIIAVEAKLSRWKDAIEQAVEYLRFANKSYIALPRQIFERNDEVLAACKRQGIGAIAASYERVQILHRAPSQRIFSHGWVWIMSRAMEQKKPTSKLHRAPHAKLADD